MKSAVYREMTIADYDQIVALWKRTAGLGLSSDDSREGIRVFL
jgi:hypothetical protein